jgi:hypothetical protein
MHRTKWLLIGTLVIVATLQICFWVPPVQAETGEKPPPYNVGQWLPSDQQALEDWRAAARHDRLRDPGSVAGSRTIRQACLRQTQPRIC